MTKCIWLTGLPCSGKTTIAKALKKYYPKCQILDGDEMRGTPLANFAGFSQEDRNNHILRMGHLAKMFVDQGITTICSFVSPYANTRLQVRAMFTEDQFVEVYLSTPLNTCSKRDVKGMYARAVAGELPGFTGVDSPYEAPSEPELTMDTSYLPIEQCLGRILDLTSAYSKPKAFFAGRWNSVYHNGHNHLIQTELDSGNDVVLAIRNVQPDDKNPWTAAEVKEMLGFRYKDEPRVEVIIIPDIASINYGRGVGYEVKEIKVTKQIAGISGTQIRELIANKDSSWKEFVPTEIAQFIEGRKA